MKLDISIVIRTKNSSKYLTEILKKVYYQKIDKSFDVVIVDSGSTDDTLKIASSYSCKIVKIPSKDFTYPFALNVGSEYAKGEYLVFLSHDAFPTDEKWLHNLTKHFSDPSVVAVRGRDAPIKGKNPVEEYSLLQTYPDLPNFEYIEDKTAGRYTNGNTAIRKNIWEKYKHPEGICYKIHPLLTGEDQIWASYLLKKGYRIVYDPRSKVYHSHKLGLKRIWPTSYGHGYFSNDLYFLVFSARKSSGKEIIKDILFRMKNLSIYFLKNKYFKAFFFDFPLSLMINKIGFYCGKKDRERDEKLYLTLYSISSNHDPNNSYKLSNNPTISNTNQSVKR